MPVRFIRQQLSVTIRPLKTGPTMIRLFINLTVALLLWNPAAAALAIAQPGTVMFPELPERLSETGLYEPGTLNVARDKLSYTPQYPLWSDGAVKKRWLHLPPGTSIDASAPDAWEFPPGTRLWKQFGYAKPIETRLIERLADGSWRYAAYVWNEDGTDAVLAPESGFRRYPALAAPGGVYPIPSRDDCRACHEGGPVPVLGITALQLSPLRDQLAPNVERKTFYDVDLLDLVARGLVRNLPDEYRQQPPRIEAATPTERAALGYLHANCGHCHNASGSLADLDFVLVQPARPRKDDMRNFYRSLVDVPSDFHLYGATQRVVPGDPSVSVLALRMRSRNPLAQMPPLGTRTVDANALVLVERWIEEMTNNQEYQR